MKPANRIILVPVIAAVVSLLTLDLNAQQKTEVRAGGVEGIFVILTSDDLQTQMMTMVLAKQTVDNGKKARIMLCGPAGDLALKEAEQEKMKPLDKSPQELLKMLIEKGVKVQVCALYLPNKQKTKEHLIEGVTAAKPSEIAEVMLNPGMKLMTL